MTTDSSLKSPVNIIVENIDLTATGHVTVNDKDITIGSHTIHRSQAPLYDSGLFSGVLPAIMSSRFIKTNIKIAVSTIANGAAELSLAALLSNNRTKEFSTGFQKAFLQQMKTGTDLIFSGDVASGVKNLRGCGFGLTPSGDDFLSGLLFAIDFIEKYPQII